LWALPLLKNIKKTPECTILKKIKNVLPRGAS